MSAKAPLRAYPKIAPSSPSPCPTARPREGQRNGTLASLRRYVRKSAPADISQNCDLLLLFTSPKHDDDDDDDDNADDDDNDDENDNDDDGGGTSDASRSKARPKAMLLGCLERNAHFEQKGCVTTGYVKSMSPGPS